MILYIFIGLISLAIGSFLWALCFPGKIHDHPEGAEPLPTIQEDPTYITDSLYKGNWKESTFSQN